MTSLRRFLITLSALAGAFAAGVAAFGGGVPSVPVSPTFSEPSQIVPTLNAFVQMLNGTAGPMNAAPPIISLGSFCTASGATPQTCNGTRGLVTTNSLATAAATNAAFVINNSLVTAASVCLVTVASYSGTLVTNGYPQPLNNVAAAGTLTVNLTNTHAANALAGTVGLAFNCIN